MFKLKQKSAERKTHDDRRKGLASLRGRSGLSIIEVIMASVLLIVAMVPILRSLTKAHMFSSGIERKTQSLVFAQNKLEEIRARSIYNFGSAGSFSANDVALGGSYYCDVTDTSAATDLRTITISVGYDLNGDAALSSDEYEATLASLIANRW
jgi:Tfp pilus assembly protein PilV